MTCGVEVTVRHRGHAWNTVYRCKLRRGHKGQHACVAKRNRMEACAYRWPRKSRTKLRRHRQRSGGANG